MLNFFDQSIELPKIKTVAKAFSTNEKKMAGDWKKVGGNRYKVMKESLGEEAFDKLMEGINQKCRIRK